MTEEKKPSEDLKKTEQTSEKSNEKTDMIPKSRFDEINAKRKAAEKIVEDVLKVEIEDIPEDNRELIPNLKAAEKLCWIRKAKKAGMFGDQKINVNSKKPDFKVPEGDLNKKPPGQRLKHLYRN